MMWLRLILPAILLSFLLTGAGFAQRLVSALSSPEVSIDSSFAGETMSLFGNVEPEFGSDKKYVEGPFQIVVVIRGPAISRVARKKSRLAGVWLNNEQLIFSGFPSYFWVLSNTKLEDITTKEILEENGLLPEVQPQLASLQGEGDPEIFGKELVRLMKEEGFFGTDEQGIHFRSDTLYSAKVKLPADVPVGTFLAQTYLFKDGVIISSKAEGFSVRKTGFERLLGNTAKQSPWLYGIFTVILALFTGWLGGVAFRR